MWRRIGVRESGLGARTLLRADIGAITKRFSPSAWADPDVVPFAARVSVWGGGSYGLSPCSYWPTAGRLVPCENRVRVFARALGDVQWPGPLPAPDEQAGDLALDVLLSAMDIVLITADIVIGGGFKSFTFLAYYPALAMFAVVFTPLWLGLAWTTMAAGAYVVVSLAVGSGLDLGGGDPSGGDLRVLVGRLAAMYAMVLCVSLITRSNARRGRLRWKGNGRCSGNASSSPRRFTTQPLRPPT